MSVSHLTYSLSVCAVAAALTLGMSPASAQTAPLDLVCAPGAAAGSAATPLVFSTDADWDMSNDGGTVWSPAYTAYKHNAWVTPDAGSNWLTPGPVTPNIPTPAAITYRSPSITVGSTVDVASIETSFKYAVDNYLDGASINAQPYTYSGLSGFSGYHPALSIAASATSGWVVGAGNHFSLIGRNAESAHTPSTPTGVLATVTLTATCLAPVPPVVPAAPTSVPSNNPVALLLASLALVGFGATRWKKRQTK